MVESSKILTVSYGTFSCTLEGFDDSFGTMKAIAEYFRDLAQGDRYFGAEPPAPDAEMLTRIAEKEIARRVEARADESGIVLRAVDALQTPAAAPTMPPVATPPTEEDVAEVATTTADVSDVAEDTPEIEDIAESSEAATADTDGDVAGQEVGDDMSPALVASSPAADDFTDSPMDDEMDASAPEVSFEDMAPDTISTVPAHPDANSIAAKLQRIRAVVGGGAPTESETTETNFSDSFAQEVDDEAPSAEDSFEEMTAEAAIEEDTSGEVAETAEAANADVEEVIEDDTAEDTIVESADDSASDSDDVSEFDAASTEDEAAHDDADQAVESASQDDVAAEDDAAEDENADMAEAEADQPKQSFRARILRVAKKTRTVPIAPDLSEDDAARVADDTAATDDNQSHDEDINASDAEPKSIFEDIDEVEVAELAPAGEEAIAALSDEDEAELLADLAAVEAEFAENAPEVAKSTAGVEAPETVTENGARSSRNVLPETDDAAMSRIMDQADEQLSEPEGSRRRSAIAQLKAAVAATEAARQLGDKADDAAAKESAFRDDLNDAVRPGAATALPRTEVRAERPRPAPLKLVASQRVDEEEAASAAAPVLPRRVSSDTASDAGSFTDFAAEMGATELPDLLEAAAAYTAYVEGIEDFSRPQIMKKVQASAAEEFSREDGLRSFGTLLRQGRISKVRNGRFQVSDQTRFKPEQKAG